MITAGQKKKIDAKYILKVELTELANNKLNAEDKRMKEIGMILKLGLQQLGRLFYLLAEMEKIEESIDPCETIRSAF